MRPTYGAARRFVHRVIVSAAALVCIGAAPPAGNGAASAPRDVHILAFGDSLTAGFGLPRNLGFAPQLEAYLRRQGVRAHVQNAGVSGDTATQGLARLTWTLDGLPQQPDIAIVELGANDMLRGQPPAQTRAALEAILAELQRRGIRTIVSGMQAAPNLGPDYAAAYNPMFGQLAAAHGAVLHPFFLEGVAGNRALNQPDGLHPTLAGVKIIVAGIAPTVLRAAR